MSQYSDLPLIPTDLNIRLAGPNDAESIARLGRELAVYERLALWPDGVGGSRLEPAGTRFLLQEISRPAAGRMEDLSD